MQHWRSEIEAAVKSGKLVIVYAAKPVERYRYTGQTTYSGNGRSRVLNKTVALINSYESVPFMGRPTAKTGSDVVLEKKAAFLKEYWTEYAAISPYQVELEGKFTMLVLRSRSGDRVVGAFVRLNDAHGVPLFLPPIQFDEGEFSEEEKSGELVWNRKGLQFGNKLITHLTQLAKSLLPSGEESAPPSWTGHSKYRIAEEKALEAEIQKCTAEIGRLQNAKVELDSRLKKVGQLRRLLFEQGRPLERSILEILTLFGFEAKPFADGESEFDAVFTSPEGRCLGEVEGKDNRAINIDKFSQLERNIMEDFAREEVREHAKGVLFGNAFRLTQVEERGAFFTEKCLSAAKRTHAALVRTPDLFEPARYLKANPSDTEYARRCRQAIFKADGEIVQFPALPVADESVLKSTLVEVPSETPPNERSQI